MLYFALILANTSTLPRMISLDLSRIYNTCVWLLLRLSRKSTVMIFCSTDTIAKNQTKLEYDYVSHAYFKKSFLINSKNFHGKNLPWFVFLILANKTRQIGQFYGNFLKQFRKAISNNISGRLPRMVSWESQCPPPTPLGGRGGG